ncbi:MAG TPA: hypothetical protein VM691_04525, partial [Myxococcales bacterium]|nr:hypothetical protein [Myxococcales bacterium]
MHRGGIVVSPQIRLGDEEMRKRIARPLPNRFARQLVCGCGVRGGGHRASQRIEVARVRGANGQEQRVRAPWIGALEQPCLGPEEARIAGKIPQHGIECAPGHLRLASLARPVGHLHGVRHAQIRESALLDGRQP